MALAEVISSKREISKEAENARERAIEAQKLAHLSGHTNKRFSKVNAALLEGSGLRKSLLMQKADPKVKISAARPTLVKELLASENEAKMKIPLRRTQSIGYLDNY